MPSIRIPKECSSGFYFLTFAVKRLRRVLDRYNRFDIMSAALKHCQENKSLKVYAYVFMPNHIHLIASAPDMIDFVRDFKKFTSKEIRKNMATTEPDLLRFFEDKLGGYEFWSKSNMPKAVETEEYFLQKAEYIHLNPVRKRFVERPEDWRWSSANPESDVVVEPVPV